jgi:hypothetical protein
MHDIRNVFPPLIHLENRINRPSANPAQTSIHSHFSLQPALPFPRLPCPSTPKPSPLTVHKYHLSRHSSIAYTTPTCDPGSNVWCKVRGQLSSARLTAAIYSYMHSVPGAQRLWVRFCVLSFPCFSFLSVISFFPFFLIEVKYWPGFLLPLCGSSFCTFFLDFFF